MTDRSSSSKRTRARKDSPAPCDEAPPSPPLSPLQEALRRLRAGEPGTEMNSPLVQAFLAQPELCEVARDVALLIGDSQPRMHAPLLPPSELLPVLP